MVNDPKVIIIGSGVTGLSLAHGLNKQGIQYEIFEKHGSAGRDRDWGITVHWAVEFLSLYPEGMEKHLQQAQVVRNRDPKQEEFVLFHNGATGEILKKVPLGPARRYSHQRIRQALLEGIDVQFGKALQSINESPDGIEVTFADASRVSGSVVIACDGSGSDTRQLLFENKEEAKWNPVPGFILNNFWFKLPAEQAIECRKQLGAFLDIAVHPNGAYYGLIPLDIDDPTKPETWKFQIFMGLEIDIKPEDDSPAKRVQLVKAAGKAFVEPFRSGVEWMPEDTYISPDRYGTWETRKWDSKGGKVILAGDAAHGMTAHRAQGLNHSLQDVLNIIAGLKEIRSGRTTLKDFVAKYVDEVVERGSDEVRMSLKQGMAVHNWTKVPDMPIMSIGTTPLHMEQSVVPRPEQ